LMKPNMDDLQNLYRDPSSFRMRRAKKLHRRWEESKTAKVYFSSKRSLAAAVLAATGRFNWETKLILTMDCLLAQPRGFIRIQCFFSF
jgi:hypothetical protein